MKLNTSCRPLTNDEISALIGRMVDASKFDHVDFTLSKEKIEYQILAKALCHGMDDELEINITIKSKNQTL